MPARTNFTTKEILLAAPLPLQTPTYTVIPHGFVIDKIMEELTAKGFKIIKEKYRCSKSANIAQGIYHLEYGDDSEMGMMFAWSNSYDKSMRFKCAIGGFIFSNESGMISGEMGSWGRRHTGVADQEVIDTIKHQIGSAEIYYAQLVKDKEAMKMVTVPVRKFSEVLGCLYLEHGLLTGEQMGIIKAEFKKPSFVYNAPKDSLWACFNHITYSLKTAHPKSWMDQQRLIHWFLCQEFGIQTIEALPSEPLSERSLIDPVATVAKDPAQIDLVDMIAEVEAENQGIIPMPLRTLEEQVAFANQDEDSHTRIEEVSTCLPPSPELQKILDEHPEILPIVTTQIENIFEEVKKDHFENGVPTPLPKLPD